VTSQLATLNENFIEPYAPPGSQFDFMKILIIITGLSTGGAESMLLKLLKGIDKNRYVVCVLSLTTIGEIGHQIQKLDIPVHAFGMNSGIPNPLCLFDLVRLIKCFQPDLVHTWMYHADLLGGLASRISGIKGLSWGIRHTDLSPSANKRSTLWVVRLCAWLSHWLPRKILVNSQVARKVHEATGYSADKMVVIPNGFDLERFIPAASARHELRSEFGLDAATPLVGVIGRFHPQKNQIGFVQVMTALHASRPDVHFLLAGQGVDSDNRVLVAAIHAAGVDGVCHLLGLRTDIPRLMAALDVLALPSVGEAFPNVVGEAMACAVPCAVTDVGDSAWIVGDTGRVVPAGDMSGLAIAVHDLLNMPSEERTALGAGARERVSSLFEIGAVVKQYEAFYESLASEGA
jgi:glycosyltransferase involved in cell wall biosynthesis